MVTTVLMTISMSITAYYWFCDGNYSLYYKLDILHLFISLLFIPAIYLYFREVTGDNERLSPLKVGLLLFPAVWIGGMTLAFYLLLGEEHSTLYTKAMMESYGNVSPDELPYRTLLLISNEYVYSLFLFLQAVIVFVYAGRRLLSYRKRLDDFFSDADDKDMHHHWAVWYGILALLLLTLIVAAAGYLLYIEYDIWVSVVGILMAIICYYTSYHVCFSQYTAESFARELKQADNEALEKGYGAPENKETPEGEAGAEGGTIRTKLLPKFNQIVDEEKIFLQKKVKVDDIARLAYTNRTYISRILKEEFHTSFGEFIKHKRIEYAKEQLLLNSKISQEELSEACGFTHSSAFSRAFRQCEGMTLTEWRRKQTSAE
ncbi:AraC family transcriptional regulator [Bacteroides sp. 214]|uniref:helix-turn-helix domain-containing protein n=1 Tax=Bacteroides sp. 214 TaxID=2302935 RepID=UPI0019402C22|nr:AraC family transcriptional regulator [Bacteroides sp. 214]